MSDGRKPPDDALSDDERKKADAELESWAAHYERLADLVLHDERRLSAHPKTRALEPPPTPAASPPPSRNDDEPHP